MQFYRLILSNGHIRYVEARNITEAKLQGFYITGKDVISVISAKDYFYKVVMNERTRR